MFMCGTVVKRIFLLFIIAAFIPALALAILSYSQVRSVLLEQSHDRLSHIARSYSLNVYERMLLADNSIKNIAFNKYNDTLPATDSMEFLRQIFLNLTIAGPDTPAVLILGKKWPDRKLPKINMLFYQGEIQFRMLRQVLGANLVFF